MKPRATEHGDMPFSRVASRGAQLLVDVAILTCAYCGAFLVRFEGAIPRFMFQTLFASLPLVLAVKILVLRARGIHRLAWRYVNLDDARRILAAVVTATLTLLCMRAVLGSSWFEVHVIKAGYAPVSWFSSPVGVLLADAVFACTGLVGARAVWRLRTERAEQRHMRVRADAVPTLLVGAGRAGALVAREIHNRPDLGLDAVGFVDDDPAKRGTSIAGLTVLGDTESLATIARKSGARQVLISMASVPGVAIRRVVRLCEEAKLPVKIVPGLYELIGGSKALAIRDVSLEDLLRREPVDLDVDVADVVRGRVVLVTGAGGSIGSELCRQIARFSPKQLILVEQAENNLFFIDRELRERAPDLSLVPLVADICDAQRIERIFTTYRPDAVFHAAAHKHVPMMEANPGEAIKNNVFGSMTVADAADRVGVGEFVLISTDKAVNPASVMGATKRAAEIYLQALSSRSRTKFVAVRFGNVLGSTGSVVPIFREQIARGGPVTITHPDMKRYFMTIPEATQLVLQAAAIGNSGEILILDMGEPVRLVDLAEDLITLSGLRPRTDIEIVFTGIRPGEKLFEELSTAEEAASRTRHPRIFVGRITPHPWSEVGSRFARLRTVVEHGVAGDELRSALRDAVPDYSWQPRATSSPPAGAVSLALAAQK